MQEQALLKTKHASLIASERLACLLFLFLNIVDSVVLQMPLLVRIGIAQHHEA